MLTWAGGDGNTFDILQRVGVPMILGVVLPTAESGPDPAVIPEDAATAQELGYTHLVVRDHMLRRTARMGDGWITSPQVPSWEESQAMLDSPPAQRDALR